VKIKSLDCCDSDLLFWISFKLYVIAYILGFNTGGKKFGEFAGFSLEKIPIF
jgi:hypothetical protein